GRRLAGGRTVKWVKLAIVRQALRNRWGAANLRKTVAKHAGDLLQMKGLSHRHPDLWGELLAADPSNWLAILQGRGIDPEHDDDAATDDDPVPEAVRRALPEMDTDGVYACLQEIPRYRTRTFDERIRRTRRALSKELVPLWKAVLRRSRPKLPLVVLDEAHHLKNPRTRLASLFGSWEAGEDAEEIAQGPLAHVFDRMLFLTATPFQLGHAELCSVLQRFEGIRWRSSFAPACGHQEFQRQLDELRSALDAAQQAAVGLDHAWGRLRRGDLVVGDAQYHDENSWWQAACSRPHRASSAGQQALRRYEATQERMQRAGELLRPWVIRHLKPRSLPDPWQDRPRRQVMAGRAIAGGADGGGGIEVAGAAVLPFLLAARATAQAPDARPVFAEGLASSYEAFLHTRRRNAGLAAALDEDDADIDAANFADAGGWYLDWLQHVIPRGDATVSASHPKMAATLERVVQAWREGEKVLVFCHYIATGRTLRQRISEAIADARRQMGAEKLGCPVEAVDEQLDRVGSRFDRDSPVQRACNAEARQLIGAYGPLRQYRDELVKVVRRYFRTPSLLLRFFPLGDTPYDEASVRKALDTADASGQTLRSLLAAFCAFLVDRCGKEDRRRYIKAVSRLQTGTHFGRDVEATFAAEELDEAGGSLLMPNVRLVNGSTRRDTRQRLMLAFNTPFFPEVLVASSVMAEGVDLHFNCRYVIHHDLCWNPSTLEQRTGRVDRVGAKAERCGRAIHVYLPYVAETQDEKMYRVVMDRQRWFQVVMGERYQVDARTTDKLAERIPLPTAAAEELAFKLEA
ncbi:MAG: DEAD/DEAH box helicase, partial [Phycisphaerae bacterium]|nr:DEAD/DEAH box helicase [Phycisphaerae bacterium]